jgi:predicted ArsR family transcriptional regulator
VVGALMELSGRSPRSEARSAKSGAAAKAATVERRDRRRRLLSLLEATPSLDPRTLARALGLDLQGLGAMLAAFEAEGLIKRRCQTFGQGRGSGYEITAAGAERRAQGTGDAR